MNDDVRVKSMVCCEDCRNMCLGYNMEMDVLVKTLIGEGWEKRKADSSSSSAFLSFYYYLCPRCVKGKTTGPDRTIRCAYCDQWVSTNKREKDLLPMMLQMGWQKSVRYTDGITVETWTCKECSKEFQETTPVVTSAAVGTKGKIYIGGAFTPMTSYVDGDAVKATEDTLKRFIVSTTCENCKEERVEAQGVDLKDLMLTMRNKGWRKQRGDELAISAGWHCETCCPKVYLTLYEGGDRVFRVLQKDYFRIGDAIASNMGVQFNYYYENDITPTGRFSCPSGVIKFVR